MELGEEAELHDGDGEQKQTPHGQWAQSLMCLMSFPLPILGSAGDEAMRDSTQLGKSDWAEEINELLVWVAKDLGYGGGGADVNSRMGKWTFDVLNI